MDIHAIDHIEFYVEDAEQAAAYLCDSFGFAVHGRGRDFGKRRSMLLRQREITFLLTSTTTDTQTTTDTHPAAEYVRMHGDGVAVIGFAVDDARAAFSEAVERGAVPTMPPTVLGNRGAGVTFASVLGFGDVEHRFVSRETAAAPFAPGVIEEIAPVPSRGGLLEMVDHIAICLPAGELAETVRSYQEVFGFSETFEERIVVGSQAMDSKVVQSASGKVTLTLIEPDTSRDPGQIDAFVAAHGGAGVQHIAFRTEDITTAVRDVTARGVRFLTTPSSYYDALTARVGPVGVAVETLRELGILADRDRSGAMLQIFTESPHPRGTLFYELIDRRGARTFGSNNIKALYEAVERQRAIDQVSGPAHGRS
jgi:4-hydroxymandelate synthase